jgi:hypothetical protein
MNPSPSFSIPKLVNADDFPQWKRRMMALLQDKDYDLVINYNPKTFDPCDTAPSITEKNKRTDIKARGLIELHVHDSVLPQITSTSSTHECWCQLHEIFQRMSISAVVVKLRKLINCQQDGRSIQDYVADVERLSSDLSSVNINLPSELISALILCNIDSRFANVATVLDTLDIESINTTKITSLLLNEESRQDQQSLSIQANAVRFSRLSTKHRAPFGHCHIHPHLPHTNDQCYAQHPELRPAGWKPRSQHTNDQYTGKPSNYHSACKATLIPKTPDSSDWHIDTGCSNHMTWRRELTQNFVPDIQMRAIQLGDNSTIHSVGHGDYKLRLQNGTLNMESTMVVPGLKKNLFSPGQAARHGYKFLIDGNFMTIFHKYDFQQPVGNVIARIKKDPDNLYRIPENLTTSNFNASFAVRSQSPLPVSLWHARLGHTCLEDVRHLASQASKGISLCPEPKLETRCEPCIMGKMTRAPFPSSSTISKEPGDLILSDVMGPFSSPCVSGYKYFVTYMDHFSRFCTVVLLRHKSEQFQHLKEFVAMFETQYSASIKELQSDNGGEYLSHQAQEWLRQKGIHHRTTVPGNSESNGLAERLNRTLTEMALCLLSHSHLPARYFPWAILTAVHLYNRRPHSMLPNKCTPYESLKMKMPDLHYLRVFGCDSYMHLQDHQRRKLDFHAKKMIHIGYASNQKAYLLLDPSSGKVLVSRNVIFEETSFTLNRSKSSNEVHLDKFSIPFTGACSQDDQVASEEPASSDSELDHETRASYDGCIDDDKSESQEQQNFKVQREPVESDPETTEPVRRSSRVTRPPGEWWKGTSAYSAAIIQNLDPNCLPRPLLQMIRVTDVVKPQDIKQALDGPLAGHWYDAIMSEYQQMIDFKTWILQELPADRKAIASKWVFDIKPSLSGDGKVRKLKARLVIKGFCQRAGVDYDETFAPVAHQESFRILLALSVQLKLQLRQLDVVGAFLNGEMEEDVFMKQPDGFCDPEQPQAVCKLNKAIYGLKQAGMVWNKQLDLFLTQDAGCIRTSADPCLYVLRRDQI